MPRASLALSLSVVALLGAMIVAQEPAPGQGPGGGRGRGGGAPPAAGRGRGRGFDAEAIARAKPVYEPQCGFCHGNDARGRAGGPDLARSLVVLADTGGKELAGFLRAGRPERGMPAFPNLTDQQITDIAEFLHERLEAARSRAATDTMASLVGDAKAGAAYFNGPGRCTTCHSISGDLAGIGAKYDPPTLQGRLVNPRPGGGGRGQPAVVSPRAARTVTVALGNGQTVSGTLDYISEFAVTLIEKSGARRTFKRDGDVPKVVVTDPLQVHFDMLRTFRDKDMQDLTAYLWTLK
ncbi:MAG TPA: c-type cytochrome [Vicinamibacterales bacterium]|nr:c-type cytochrome [Vicinamibacterales bacterium]